MHRLCNFLLVTLVVLAFFFLIPSNVEAGSERFDARTLHSPIHIVGDAGFTQANGVVNGSGTQNEPYIIEGWEIDGNGGSYCIWIENTTAYFVIRNCTLRNTTGTEEEPHGCALLLANLTNGYVEATNITYAYIGLGVVSSKNTSITANTVFYNDYPIIVGGSDNITVSSNTVQSNAYGIGIMDSANITVEKNLVIGGAWGICLESTVYSLVIENNVSDTSLHGIWLAYSSNNTIIYNTISNSTGYGVNVTANSTQNGIYYNNFINNNGAGYGNSKGVSGKSQAYDDAGNNTWCFAFGNIRAGNYWSNWDGNDWGTPSAYPIDGGSGASDWYPLSEPVPECSGMPVALLLSACILFGYIMVRKRRQRHI